MAHDRIPTLKPEVRFIVDAGHLIPSAAAVDHANLELQALRREWLLAIAEFDITEEQARALGAGLWMRAPNNG